MLIKVKQPIEKIEKEELHTETVRKINRRKKAKTKYKKK
jgi:hypothetical protein